MNELLQWALMAIGVTYLITEASIAASFRVALVRSIPWWGPATLMAQLIYCPACVGFWVGIALAMTGWWPYEDSYWALSESGFASMALMTTWSKLTGGNGAFEAEDPLDLAAQTEDGAPGAQEDTDD